VPVILDLVLVAVGLLLLAKAADEFVLGAARLSAVLRIAPVVIGAIVIGVGTSLPEMLVSGLAAGQGKLDIAAGNIIGSNVANLTLVLGVAAILVPITTRARILRRELPLATGAVILFAIAIQGGLTRLEGGLLLGGLVVAVGVILLGARRGDGDEELAADVEEFVDPEHLHDVRVGREVVRTLLGLIGTVAGAQAMVSGASGIAAELGLGEGFVGLTLVAIGTSLPELVTAVAAARKGEDELIIGNLLGSNLFNSFGVAGVAGLVGPGPLVDGTLAGGATWLMIAVVIVSAIGMFTERALVRWEGVVLVGAYVVAVPFLA
jgi:cation:H+ antiporter